MYLFWRAVKCGGLGCSTGGVYSVHHPRNCLTAESLEQNYNKQLYREQTKEERASDREDVKSYQSV